MNTPECIDQSDVHTCLKLIICKFEISHQITRHFGTNTSLLGGLSQLMAYYGNASRQLFESLQGYPDLRKVSWSPWLVTKIMFGCHGNKKSADFYQDFSENQQFYLVHAKIIHFSFVLSVYTE